MAEITEMRVSELIDQLARIEQELLRRGVMRTRNGLAGELAEFLFSKAFGWTLTPPSEKSHDAFDDHRIRYQIKGRRFDRELGVIRGLITKAFTCLAASSSPTPTG